MAFKRILRWTLVLVWLYLVVHLSRQSGSDSAAISGWIAAKVSWGLNLFGFRLSYSTLHIFLRKFAHFGTHLVLAYLSFRALSVTTTSQKLKIILCLLACSAVAIYDESIQANAVGRVAQIYDAILNLFGVQSGVTLGILTTKTTQWVTALRGRLFF